MYVPKFRSLLVNSHAQLTTLIIKKLTWIPASSSPFGQITQVGASLSEHFIEMSMCNAALNMAFCNLHLMYLWALVSLFGHPSHVCGCKLIAFLNFHWLATLLGQGLRLPVLFIHGSLSCVNRYWQVFCCVCNLPWTGRTSKAAWSCNWGMNDLTLSTVIWYKSV